MIFLPVSMKRRRSPERSALPHGRADLGVPLDRVADLPVEEEPVGDDDDGVEDRGAVLRKPEPEPDQLMREPGDGVALPLPAECWTR